MDGRIVNQVSKNHFSFDSEETDLAIYHQETLSYSTFCSLAASFAKGFERQVVAFFSSEWAFVGMICVIHLMD